MTAEKYRYSSRRSRGWRTGDDVDEVAVMRACRGERLLLTTAERKAAVKHLEREGLRSNEIARRLGVCFRTVQRHRSKGLAGRPLTGRQLQVLGLRAGGRTYDEIGEDLSIARQTVVNHIHHAARKLGARNYVHAVAIAIRAGLI